MRVDDDTGQRIHSFHNAHRSVCTQYLALNFTLYQRLSQKRKFNSTTTVCFRLRNKIGLKSYLLRSVRADQKCTFDQPYTSAVAATRG